MIKLEAQDGRGEVEPPTQRRGRSKHHGLAARRRQALPRRLAHQLGAIAVGKDETSGVG